MKSTLIYGVLALAPSGFADLAAADALRDPTRPPLVVASHESSTHEATPILSAIMGTSHARIAIFNGQLVRSGGTVGNYAIEEVLEDHVRYRHAGLTQELYLPIAAAFKKLSTVPARPPTGVQ